MASAIVVDTMIASAWLGTRDSARKTRWRPLLSRSPWVLPFTVVAEMRFGAEVAGRGCPTTRRLGATRRIVQSDAAAGRGTDAYVDLRTWCVRDGHGLSAKDHEADRWVAAVALAAELPLASEDSIFGDIPQLRRADPGGSSL